MHQLRHSTCTGHVILLIIDDTLRLCMINTPNVIINDDSGFRLLYLSEQDLEPVESVQSLLRNSYQVCQALSFC